MKEYINYEQLGQCMFIIKGFRLTVLDMEEVTMKTIDIRQINKMDVITDSVPHTLAIHYSKIEWGNELTVDGIICTFKGERSDYFKERMQDIKKWLERLIKEYQY